MTLRARLTLWYTGVLAAVLALFGVVVFLSLTFTLTSQIERTLNRTADDILRASGMPQNAEERFVYMTGCMHLIYTGGIPVTYSFPAPPDFLAAAGPHSGKHYPDPAKGLWASHPDARIFRRLSILPKTVERSVVNGRTS